MVKARVLIVGDESGVAADLGACMKKLGYEVHGAGRMGQETLNAVDRLSPDLLFLDTATSRSAESCVRRTDLLRCFVDMPIVFVTADGDLSQAEGTNGSHLPCLAAPFADREVELVTEMGLHIARLEQERIRVERALQEKKRNYQVLLKNLPGIVFRGFKDWSAEFMDSKIETLTGYRAEQFNSRAIKWSDVIVSDDVGSLREAILGSMKTGKSYVREYRIRTRSGENRWIQERGQVVFGARGQLQNVDGVLFDITEQRLAQEALQESENKHRAVLEAAPDPVAIYDTAGKAVYLNPAFTRVFGWSLEETELKYMDFVPDEALPEAWTVLEKLHHGGTFTGIETQRLTRDGRRVDVSISGAVFLDGRGRPQGSVLTLQDITERKRHEERIRFIAYHDILTRLPNRKSFYMRLEDILNQYPRRSGNDEWALLFLDLDQFKYVNDTLGHDIGDELLKEVAVRIQGCLRRSDYIFRLGGDEFTVILTNLSKGIDVAKVAEKIREQVAVPYHVKGHEIHVTVSIGISVYPSDGNSVETLVKNADMAMYAAKEERHGYRFYTEEMNRKALERMRLESSLRQALQQEQFVLYYQPLVGRDSELLGMEALLRWQHPELGLLGPAQFISLAEETGAIIPIGEWVLHSACRQLKKWHSMGHGQLYVAVNLSARQFKEPDLVDKIQQALEDIGLSPASLKLELTESCVMEDPEEAIARMRALNEQGIRFSIDDFGTGYSSLSYLKRLPIDTLKIDRSFVCDAMTNREDQEIIRTILSMAQSLDIDTVAEGVETAAQHQFLMNNGCYTMQGYYFGRPMPESDFETILGGNGSGKAAGDSRSDGR